VINSSNKYLPRFLVFCLLLLFHGGLLAANENSPHPLKPTFLSNGSYCEAYKLSAVLEDETFIETELMVTNIGFRDSNAACQILVLRPGEKPWKASQRYGRSGWNYSDTPNPALSIGKCRIAQENGSTICTMAFGNAAVTISLNGAPNPVNTPAAINCGAEKDSNKGKASSDFYNYKMLIPWSRLQALICLPGQPKKLVSGSGILVNSRSVGYPKDFSRGWVYYYGCREGCRLLVDFRFPLHDTGGVAGWIWKDNEPMPQPVSSIHMSSESHVVGGKESRSVVISMPDGSFTISSQLELCRYSIIDDLGPILGTIIKIAVGNPVTRFYNAQVTLSPSRPPAYGVLEVMRFE
jgi:hypothetical protein